MFWWCKMLSSSTFSISLISRLWIFLLSWHLVSHSFLQPLSNPPLSSQLLCLKSHSCLLQEEVETIVYPFTPLTLTTIMGGPYSREETKAQEGQRTRPQRMWQNREHDSFSDADFYPRLHYLEHKVMFEWHSDSWWLWPSWQGTGGNSQSWQGGRLPESRGISPPHVLPLLPKFLHTLTPNPISQLLKYLLHTCLEMARRPNSCFSLWLQICNHNASQRPLTIKSVWNIEDFSDFH